MSSIDHASSIASIEALESSPQPVMILIARLVQTGIIALQTGITELTPQGKQTKIEG